MTKSIAKTKATARSDSIALCRGQHAGLYDSAGQPRRIVDHPANARLLGTRPEVCVVRAADVALDPGDAMVVVYAGQGGAASRVAAATTIRGDGDAMGLVDWQVEPGFDHVATTEEGRTVHRLARTPDSQR